MDQVSFRMLALVALGALAVANAQAGTDPIQDVQNQPVAQAARGGATTAQQVGCAVLAAGAMREWQMSQTAPGMIKAVYAQRDFSVEVGVEYTASSFSIHYVTSQNLKYGTNKEGQPVIHSNYNRWVNNLRADTLTLLPFVGNCAM